ncbi:LysR family transcriptional regulator [Cupriavidus basilensis]|uniref:LysR family transcriptional regulator n=1 Tax=Cupriavidus basilensis TaxID=68895 RepID=A0A643FLW2_9BURK|nr:LysR substrate-binding domain-containing protein [Cupriavidus basilensis]QOT82051.1 LysR family transcriptional regulator [Cupriavidus basilensis]
MKNHQLRALVSIAQYGSMRAAAKALSLSQTALTKSIREFELELHATLLHRSPQGVQLTDVGNELLHHAKLILAEMDEARAAVRAMLGRSTPRVTAAVTPAFSVLCLPQTLERFRSRFPDATLSIRDAFLSQTLPMLRDGTVDLAITALLPDTLGPDLSFEPWGMMSIAIVGRRGRFSKALRTIDSLTDAAWIMDSSSGGISEAVRRWLTQHNVSMPSTVIECPSSFASMVLITQGDVIAPVPRAMLSTPWLASSEEIGLVEASPTVPFGIVIRAGSRLDAPANWFLECARITIKSSSLDS